MPNSLIVILHSSSLENRKLSMSLNLRFFNSSADWDTDPSIDRAESYSLRSEISSFIRVSIASMFTSWLYWSWISESNCIPVCPLGVRFRIILILLFMMASSCLIKHSLMTPARRPSFYFCHLENWWSFSTICLNSVFWITSEVWLPPSIFASSNDKSS